MRRQTLVIPIALLLAVMAAAGVVLYTMNVKEEATTGGPTSTVVVASEDVPAGTELDPLIEEGKLVEQEITKNYIVPGAVGSLEELQGRTVSQPLVEGRARSWRTGSTSSARSKVVRWGSLMGSPPTRWSCVRSRPWPTS